MATLSGTAKDALGNNIRRLVRAYRRDTGAFVNQTYSDASTGAWSITTADTLEHFAIMHDTNEADLFYDRLKLGIHGITSITDVSGKTLTSVGSPSITTSTGPFSSPSSIAFNGSSALETTSTLTDFVFGTGDFDIDLFVKISSGNVVLLDFYTAGQNGWQIFVTSSGYLQWYTSSAEKTGAINIATNTWKHIRVVRASGTLYFYVNGVLDGAGSSNATNLSYGTTKFTIGGQGNGSYRITGNLADIRLLKGVTRQIAAFTPPTVPFFKAAIGTTENAVILDRLTPV